jgi:hypothetical protein
MPMHLASDYIHRYKVAGGHPARCRVRIYSPTIYAPVVICSELPNNSGRLDHKLRGGNRCRGNPLPRAIYSSSVD